MVEAAGGTLSLGRASTCIPQFSEPGDHALQLGRSTVEAV